MWAMRKNAIKLVFADHFMSDKGGCCKSFHSNRSVTNWDISLIQCLLRRLWESWVMSLLLNSILDCYIVDPEMGLATLGIALGFFLIIVIDLCSSTAC
jgi:hypothetical protein